MTLAHAAQHRPGGFRLTRRGRLVLRGVPLILSVCALTAAAVFFAGILLSPPAASADVPAAELQTITVMPGDSLWSIAQTVAPGQDPYVIVERLDQLNSLEGRAPEPGEELFLPFAA
ncbi:LysM peptidoglycan-binding domain-containing protein [Micrococcus sp.]|uniref:LysM peptidoglycan-binding domain-containing protein n=1 Tax=Micrococcus sp. TaxID=1271 RepID=UPI002A909F49|nr:LysM peptidoglycan-binding domain-containing protein [Micrococcus sp.]MDY6055106.1 peptidoglycan-binding protein LysM [Micrococcus sp.]